MHKAAASFKPGKAAYPLGQENVVITYFQGAMHMAEKKTQSATIQLRPNVMASRQGETLIITITGLDKSPESYPMSKSAVEAQAAGKKDGSYMPIESGFVPADKLAALGFPAGFWLSLGAGFSIKKLGK